MQDVDFHLKLLAQHSELAFVDLASKAKFVTFEQTSGIGNRRLKSPGPYLQRVKAAAERRPMAVIVRLMDVTREAKAAPVTQDVHAERELGARLERCGKGPQRVAK